MYILFNGLPYFGNKIANDLRQSDSGHRFRYFNTYYSFLDKIAFLLHLPFADLVVSMNGVSDPSAALDKVLFFKKKLVLFWQGTDVMLAMERFQHKTINRKYIDYSYNICDTDWLIQELKSCEITCEKVDYKWLTIHSANRKFEQLSVFSYLPTDKEVFYGWEIIQKLAKEFPSIPFYVAGSKGAGLEIPSNVNFLGWINSTQMQEQYQQHPIFIRLTAHDGYSLAVMEALAHGAEVLWSMPHQQCFQVNSIEQARSAMEKAVAAIQSRTYKPNKENMEFIRLTMNREIVLKNLIAKLTAYAKQ